MEGGSGELSTDGEFVGGMERLAVSLDYDALSGVVWLVYWCAGRIRGNLGECDSASCPSNP